MKKNQNNAVVMTTSEAQTALESAVNALQAALTEDVAVSRADALRHRAAQALATLNKCRESDVFASAADVAALADMGVYVSYSFTFDKKTGEAVYSNAPALLSLNRFISSTGAPVHDSMWRGKVKDALHLSIIKLAQGLRQDIPALLLKLKASGEVVDAVKNGKKNKDGEMSYEVVQAALQTALDSIVFDTTGRDDGLNRYRVNRQACRWLEASFGLNTVTGGIVCPRDEGMYDRMFLVMRHIIAGMALSVEVAEKMAKAEKESK